MKISLIPSLITALILLIASPSLAKDPIGSPLVGTWFLEVSGVAADGSLYQNIMNVSADGTADIVGGWMFGAGGIKFTDSPASVTKFDGNNFEITMFAFLADAKTGVPKGLNMTIYRGELQSRSRTFEATADLYYLPCTIKHCPAPDLAQLGKPATVAQVQATRLAMPN
ncbi:MAG: hypothetical protein OIF56_15235 [Cohaesibacter sp.]|nr:hypothetical protein [Cohaesibacter sp.]